jgi:uncharacterized protein (DUF305 family)
MRLRSFLGRVIPLLLAAVVGAGVYAAATDRGGSTPPLLAASDIGFAQDMAAHHQQAVMMTDMLTGDIPPDINALAEQIRFTQLAEIGQMTGWLQLAGAPMSAAAPMAWMMSDHNDHQEHEMGMPGMASPDELTRLQRSAGRDNHIVFLELMIRHHQGGITMAGHAARTSTDDTIRGAAAVMVAEQTEEIQVMTVLLDRLRAGP